MTKKRIATITGIRPDFIRMSEIFKKLDENFHHLMIHTGQHWDDNLSKVFFTDLNIRDPDINLSCGISGKDHFDQIANKWNYLKIFIDDFNPETIIFLGDSNSVLLSVPLKKDGHHITHIEAGMRSYDNRMLEEINRKCCDHVSDLLFCYHDNYKNNLLKEGVNEQNVFVVGNTIKEVVWNIIDDHHITQKSPTNDFILLDLHRPENILYPNRMKQILKFCSYISTLFGVRVLMLQFNRTMRLLDDFKINPSEYNIETIPLMGYIDFIEKQYNSLCCISDSGTAQEEPALLGTPVLVPRDFTERPESYKFNCSKQVEIKENQWYNCYKWVDNFRNGKIHPNPSTEWLGHGGTSDAIINILKHKLG